MEVDNHHIRMVRVLVQVEAFDLSGDIDILAVRIVPVASEDTLDDDIHVVDSFLDQVFLGVDMDPVHLKIKKKRKLVTDAMS